ncbi:hypothetical protein [Staphylococcus sp. HMSC061G12]|uniref:hypothetical protein n=1 Tax=Staphylococcus sp. HMSC061G12 TaxID=1739441 RepID=UPI0008A84AC4|nr:hypothetical protein [Staphylococcus sp. HMSC061G12]OHR53653.1 hypothetical protein HMPREF2937_11440 [Staphylococcus sp. HMSC061G12]
MSLSPKPGHFYRKKSWEDLDKMLQSLFNDEDVRNPNATIDVNDYIMSKNEIVEEAKKNMCKVTVNGDYITFE